MAKKLFTEEELKELGRHTLDMLQEAIDQGDKERAKKLARRMHREFLSMHDLYRDWCTCLLTFVGRRFGDEVLFEALEESMEPWFKDITNLYPREDVRKTVEMLAGGLKGHLHPLRVEEDEEKVTIMMDPCGSGGRMLKAGCYGPPRNYLVIERAQPMTWDREDFPVYCAHCFFQDALPIGWGVPPVFVTKPAEKLGEGLCRFIIYKDPKAIPREVYERVERSRRKKAK